MDINKSFANTHSVIDNSIYMKNGNRSNKYVFTNKPSKIQYFVDL